MASISSTSQTSHITQERRRGARTRDPGAPLSGRTMWLFAGMVVTGSVALGLITSAIASLIVPENQIGLRPYLVSSLPAVLMLFIAIGPGVWCYWCWRRIFPPVQRPPRRSPPRRRPARAAVPMTRAVVPRAGPRPVSRPPDPRVTQRARADLLKRREERRHLVELRRAEQRRREAERALETPRIRETERKHAAERSREMERNHVAERSRERAAGASPPAPVPVARRPTPLAELRLPGRIETTLRQDGVETIEQLTSRTQAEVLELRGIGARSLEEILAALDRAGRALRYPQRIPHLG